MSTNFVDSQYNTNFDIFFFHLDCSGAHCYCAPSGMFQPHNFFVLYFYDTCIAINNRVIRNIPYEKVSACFNLSDDNSRNVMCEGNVRFSQRLRPVCLKHRLFPFLYLATKECCFPQFQLESVVDVCVCVIYRCDRLAHATEPRSCDVQTSTIPFANKYRKPVSWLQYCSDTTRLLYSRLHNSTSNNHGGAMLQCPL